MQFARWLHVLGVVVWVGGMFFAHMALRPSVQSLAPPQRLPLLAATLTRFVAWAGVAVAAILVSGIVLIRMLGGMAVLGASVHAMIALGAVMILVYGYLVLSPLQRLRAGAATGEWAAAGAAMSRVRQLVALNLVLGLVTLTIAVLGHA